MLMYYYISLHETVYSPGPGIHSQRHNCESRLYLLVNHIRQKSRHSSYPYNIFILYSSIKYISDLVRVHLSLRLKASIAIMPECRKLQLFDVLLLSTSYSININMSDSFTKLEQELCKEVIHIKTNILFKCLTISEH